MRERLRRGRGAREIESKGVLLRQRERQRRREGLIYSTRRGLEGRDTMRDVEKRHGERQKGETEKEDKRERL